MPRAALLPPLQFDFFRALDVFFENCVEPACQLLIPRLARHDRGTATSLHLTVYYAAGGLGGYLPGFALDRGWGTLIAVCVASIGGGLAASLGLRATLAR